MHKKLSRRKIVSSIAIGTVSLLIGLSVFHIAFSPNSQKPSVIPSSSMEKMLHVGGHNPDYIKINDAIAAAKKDETVFVHSDLAPYHENIVIDKSIRLIGENKNTTIIDGNGKGDVVRITADEVYFSNFTVRNGGTGHDCLNDAAIEITSSNNIISNNICLSTNYGIWVRNSTKNTIINNSCIVEYDGIWLLNSGNNLLRNNSMACCGLVLDGLFLSDFIQDIDMSNTANGKPVYYYKSQNDVRVPSDAGQVILVNCKDCIVSGLDISAVTDGIQILHSQRNTIENNKIVGTVDFGIRLVKSDYNTITNNVCSDNPVGVGFKSGGDWIQFIEADCKHNTITNNNLLNNYYCGVLLDSSDQNVFSKNNFIGNERSVLFQDSHKNRWRRNYWDDWVGARYRILMFMPKAVMGTRPLNLLNERIIPWINFDLLPARKPYDTQ